MDSKIAIVLVLSIAAIAISMIALSTNFVSSSLEQVSHYAPTKKEFWLFDSSIPGFNETKMGMPHDTYSTPTIAVFKGDKVVIHFFNTEEIGGDSHSFTMLAPYGMNIDVNPGENKTITFDASYAGTFYFFCTFHQPTMRGQLIVQSAP